MQVKKFLPFEHVIYLTPLPLEEVITRLGNTITKEEIFRWGMYSGKPSKPYEGWIRGHRFSMQRIINYRNSFLPRIDGVVHHKLGKVLIDVKIQLHMFTKVFMIFWCGTLGFFSVVMMIQMVSNPELRLVGFIPLLMCLFGYGLTMAGFHFERNSAKADLQKLFEAEVIEA